MYETGTSTFLLPRYCRIGHREDRKANLHRLPLHRNLRLLDWLHHLHRGQPCTDISGTGLEPLVALDESYAITGHPGHVGDFAHGFHARPLACVLPFLRRRRDITHRGGSCRLDGRIRRCWIHSRSSNSTFRELACHSRLVCLLLRGASGYSEYLQLHEKSFLVSCDADCEFHHSDGCVRSNLFDGSCDVWRGNAPSNYSEHPYKSDSGHDCAVDHGLNSAFEIFARHITHCNGTGIVSPFQNWFQAALGFWIAHQNLHPPHHSMYCFSLPLLR